MLYFACSDLCIVLCIIFLMLFDHWHNADCASLMVLECWHWVTLDLFIYCLYYWEIYVLKG